MPLTIPQYITIKTAAGATAAFLSPSADGLKDVFIDNELNGSCTLTFSLPTTSDKKQYLTEAYRIYAPDSTGTMKEFIILTPDSIDRTRDGKEVWDKITAQESWVKLGKDYIDPGISNDPQTPSPPTLAVIVLSGGSDLSGGLYTVGSAAHALYAVLQGTGWSVGTVDQTGTHDLETEKISVLANIQKIQEIWGGYLVWDSVNKTVSLRDETTWAPYSGYQIRYAKNLKGITRTSDFDIITKLYPFGEDDLNIGSVNGGVIYLTNNTYTAEVLEGIYTNQDKTTAQELKDEATKYLAKVCKPRHNYRIDQVDLRTLSGYTHESFDVGHMVDIIDTELDTNDKARVIRHRFNVFQSWICELEVGDPLDTDAKLIADSQISVKYLNGIKNSKGQITAYKLVDGSVISQKIAAAAVDATKLDTKVVVLLGDTWTDNSPAGGSVAWNQHKLYYAGVEHVILAGNTAQKYIYWDGAANTYSASATEPDLTDGQFYIAVNNVGLHDMVWNAPAARKFIGSLFIADAAIKTAHIEDLAVTDAKIASLTANKITTGQLLAYLVEIMGKNGYFKINGDEFLVYDKSGALMGRFGHYETLGTLVAAFTRASVAYDDYGVQAASGVPRYPYMALPAPVWKDLFDADQLAAEYTSGGDVAGTPTVSGGVLTYAGGTQATLLKKDLLLQDCDIVINSDQAQDGGIVARWQDANNYYLLALSDDSGASPASNLNLYKRVGGTLTSLATADITWARGTSKPIKLSLRGSRLEAWFDEVKVIEKTDTTFTGGAVGVRNSSTTAFRVLDFKVYYVQQGVMVEETSTNVLLQSEAFDAADWVKGGTPVITANSTVAPNGTTTADTIEDNDAAAWEYVYQDKTAANGETWTVSLFIKKDTTTSRFPELGLDFLGGTTTLSYRIQLNTSTGAITTRVNGASATVTVKEIAGYWKLTITGTNNSTGNGTVRFIFFPAVTATWGAAEVGATGSCIIWGAQLEKKSYPTGYMATTTAAVTRSAEALTTPAAGVLSVAEGTIKLLVKRNTAGNLYQNVFAVETHGTANTNCVRVERVANGDAFKLITGNSTGSVSNSPTFNLTPNVCHLLEVSWLNGVYQVLIDGVLQTGFPWTATYYPSSFSGVTIDIGFNYNFSGREANSIVSDFAVLNKAETLADHQADYNSGLPLSVTEATTYLMSCDGTLQPTVRKFGQWSKNGEIILDAPPIGSGIKVNDAAGLLKLIIGQYATGKYGIKVIDGEIYSTLFRTGTETDTAYIALTPPNTFRVVNNNQTTLEITAGGSNGVISFFESGTEYLRADAAYSISSVLHSVLRALNSRPLALIGPAGGGQVVKLNANGSVNMNATSSISLNAATEAHVYVGAGYNCVVHGNLYVDGNITKSGTVSYIEPTLNYGTRLLYIVETPELKYYDSGVIHLLNGEAMVKFDPIFLECIEPDTDLTPWQIWVECYGENGVYVSEVGETYFKVKERNGGMSSNKVVWRFEATRKNYAGIRLMEVVK